MTLIYPPHPHLLLTPPRLEDFTWVNQGGAVAHNARRGLTIKAPTSAGDNLRMLVVSTPEPPYTATICVLPFVIGRNYAACGMVLRESASNKLVTFNLTGRSTALSQTEDSIIEVAYWNSPTSWNGSTAHTSHPMTTEYWLQIADTGVNRIMRVSPDGETWIDYHSESRTQHITPDQIGFYLNVNRTAFGNAATFIHWSLE